MFTQDDEKELEQQADEASLILLLLLFFGRKNVSSNREVKFDKKRGVFIVDGKRVSESTMRTLMAQVEKIGRKRAEKHTADLIAGKIDLIEWRNRMRGTLRVSHWMAAALALGGLEAARNNQLLDARINSELTYLDGFYQDIQNGKVSDAKKKSRSGLYLLALFVTFSLIEQAFKSGLIKIVKPKGGGSGPVYTEARRYRRASESCKGCIANSGFWMPIKEMPAIGSLECGSYCRCFIVYR